MPGNHLDEKGRAKGRPFRAGFEENIEFFRLDYLDADDVDLGQQFKAILPALWLAAGGVGKREVQPKTADLSLPSSSTYGVLFKESRLRKFKEALRKHSDVTHAYLVTDSEDAYSEMCSELPRALRTSMLYRDYLRNFRINTGWNL